MNILKSIGVVLLAFLVNTMLSVVTDFLLEQIGILPKPEKGLFETSAILICLSYRAIYFILTGFIIAKLAPNKTILHTLILGVIVVAIILLSVINPEFSHKSKLWFGYTLAAMTIPCLWLGVKIQQSWNKK
jgi:hypothetical protein